MPALPLLHILIVVFLVLANAFFVAVEFALVSVRRTRLQQLASQGNSRAETALKLVGNLNSVLSGTQLGITLASRKIATANPLTSHSPSVDLPI